MIVSIDIGTSYSSISMLAPDGKAQPVDTNTGVSMYGGKYSLPSAVFVEENGQLMLGQAAMNSRMRKPQNFRDEFKRNLGENIPILLGDRKFLPEELYTEFFRHMKSCAEKVSGEQVDLAYLTYPASYGKTKKDKIISAAKAAGLFNVELVDEPTAAAMSYCAAGYVKDGENLLIYDFGGGTFDVSVIRYENGEFRQLTNALGLERCGGIDIDRLIFRDMMSKVPGDTMELLQKNTMHYMRFVSQLSELAVKCKHHLSSADHFAEYIMVGFDSISYSLTLEQYNQMIAEMVGQTIQICRQALEEAKLKVSDLAAVLLVGGTSRVRLVREMVEQMAGGVPVYCAADLELAVSQGALNYRKEQPAEPEQKIEQEKKAETEQKSEPKPDAESWYQKGAACYKEGKYEAAAACYLNAALLDYPQAQSALGNLYLTGKGVRQDTTEAVQWFERAANQGDVNGQLSLGLHYKPAGGLALDVKRGAYWYRKAAEQGDELAQYELGKCYESGAGVAKDNTEAVRWYQAAADQEFTLAYFKLGRAYEYGTGVAKNLELARKWYRLAAEDDDKRAAESLKRLDERTGSSGSGTVSEQAQSPGGTRTGEQFRKEQATSGGEAQAEAYYRQGVQLDNNGQKQQAFTNYLTAAMYGHPAAQLQVGMCYEYGNVVSKDWKQADSWYQKAEAQGNAEATNRRRALAAAQGHAAAKDALKGMEKPKTVTLSPELIVRRLLKKKQVASDFWHIEALGARPAWVNTLFQNLKISPTEKILVAKNTTLFWGAGKDGFIFTERGIYHKYWASDPTGFIPWKEFAKSNFSYGTNGVELTGKVIRGAQFCGSDGEAFWTQLHQEMQKWC